MKTTVKTLLTIVALTATPLVIQAQDATKPSTPAATAAPAAGADNQGDRRGGNNNQGNFEDFRKRMEERIKTSLKVTDDEWSVIQPLIEKVTEKQREAGASRFGGGFGGNRGNRGGNNTGGTTAAAPAPAADATQPARPGSAESTALRTALESDTTTPEELKTKLAAVREVRKKGAAELATARDELRKVVTVRQEAVLVSMGILE